MTVPAALSGACREGRLLVLWAALPFALEERPPANRALALNRLRDLGADPGPASGLPGLPPLPILSLDPSARAEQAFARAGIPLAVQEVPARGQHSLMKLAGDLETRSGVVLSGAEVRDLPGDPGKRRLLDEARRTARDGAVLILGCDPASDDFRAWWAILAPALRAAAFALGDPSAPWPEGITCLDSDLLAASDALWAAQAPTEGGTMNTITWLHLSDFHFRAGQQHTWNENIVLEALLDDVRERIADDGLQPDLIGVSGDIAFSGKPEEYALARAFFEQLLAATRLPRDRLFLVPGNHDVDRSAISRGAQAIADALADRDAANAILSTPADRQLLFARFAGYADFVNEYLAGHLPFDDEGYYYVKFLDVAGQRLALLGLNSAWVASSDADRARGLLLGERQTRSALRQADGDGATLKLALLHHPFDWLREFDRADSADLLTDRCDFILHGHLHQTAATRLSSPDGEATVLACGACYQTREYPNMVNWVRLDLAAGTGTVYLRRYSDARGGFWAPDTLTYRNAPDGVYTFPLPAGLGPAAEPVPPAVPVPEPGALPSATVEPAGHRFRLTLQRRTAEGWPIVAEHQPPGDALAVRDEGLLRLDLEELDRIADRYEYGVALGRALFQGDVQRAFDQALGASGHNLRILLYVEAEDLRTLHWERLCADLDLGWDFIALEQRLPFSLALPSRADRLFPPIGRSDLRALVVVASPDGLEQYGLRPFNAERTLAKVQAALGPIPHDLLAAPETAAGPPTLEALIDRLIDGHYTLLHLVCHGSYRPQSGETTLYLATGDGQVDPILTSHLLRRLGRLRSEGSLPYFTFLATCESASPEAEAGLGGLAHRLVRRLGLPAVLAMTEPVTLDTAGALASRFYERLWVHGEPDRALVEACGRLAARGDATVPVLYSRLGGRPLFTDGPAQPTQTPADPTVDRPAEHPTTPPPDDEPDVQQLLATIRIDPDDPPYAALRELLSAAYDPEGLRRFCEARRAFRPVLDRIGPDSGLDRIIDKLLSHCRTQLLWDDLVAEVAGENPKQVARFAERLHGGTT